MLSENFQKNIWKIENIALLCIGRNVLKKAHRGADLMRFRERFEKKEEQITSKKMGQDLWSRKRMEIIGVIVHVGKQPGKHILALDGKEKCITPIEAVL